MMGTRFRGEYSHECVVGTRRCPLATRIRKSHWLAQTTANYPAGRRGKVKGVSNRGNTHGRASRRGGHVTTRARSSSLVALPPLCAPDTPIPAARQNPLESFRGNRAVDPDAAKADAAQRGPFTERAAAGVTLRVTAAYRSPGASAASSAAEEVRKPRSAPADCP